MLVLDLVKRMVIIFVLVLVTKIALITPQRRMLRQQATVETSVAGQLVHEELPLLALGCSLQREMGGV